jgi:hypothetical protein
MKGEKIPFTNSRAGAYMRFNPVFDRDKIKKQKRKEYRRFLKLLNRTELNHE